MFIEIDIENYTGFIPTGKNLVIAERGDEEETALVLYGFDEVGLLEEGFDDPVYGFMKMDILPTSNAH